MRLKFLQNIAGAFFGTKNNIKEVPDALGQKLIDQGVAELDDAKATIAKQQEQINQLQTLINKDYATENTLIGGDLWQRLTFQGKGFATTPTFTTISNTNENDYLLLINPEGSGRVGRLKEFIINSKMKSTNSTVYRFYRNPIITNNGTQLTISKIRADLTNSSVFQAFQTPSISNKGSLIAYHSIGFTYERIDLKLARYLIDGAKLLVTIQPEVSGNEHGVIPSWAEV